MNKEKSWKIGPVYVTLSFCTYSFSYGFGIGKTGGYINCSPLYLDVDYLPKKYRLKITKDKLQ